MIVNSINTDAEYQTILKRLEVIFDAKLNTVEGDELEMLSTLIEDYEKIHFPIEKPYPNEALKFRLEQLGVM